MGLVIYVNLALKVSFPHGFVSIMLTEHISIVNEEDSRLGFSYAKQERLRKSWLFLQCKTIQGKEWT